MSLQLTLSCVSDQTETGPTLIHSIGVENYKIPADVIAFLQEALTNELISDNDEGVLCQENPQRILEILQQNDFSLQEESTENDKTIWIVVKNDAAEASEATNNRDNEGNADEGDGQATDEQQKEEEEAE